MATPVEVGREDQLRLHVLIERCEAIRIDEPRMTAFGLASGGREHVVKLNASGTNEERYLKAVRQLLSSQVMNSPGGFPVFLKRWTRMGQIDSDRLARLLKLGEPEAVVAVACSPGLSIEIAKRAWWAHPVPEIARFLLAHESVRRDALGGELVAFLYEHLPFESEPAVISRTVKLVLETGQAGTDRVQSLWRQGQRKTSILLGFVQTCSFKSFVDVGGSDRSFDNEILAREFVDFFSDAELATVSRLLSGSGRMFLWACERVLDRPADQDVVVECLQAISKSLAPVRPCEPCASIDEIESQVNRIAPRTAQQDVHHGAAIDAARAIRFLSLTGEPLVRAYFARSSTVGSLMRKQLAPTLNPVVRNLKTVSGYTPSL